MFIQRFVLPLLLALIGVAIISTPLAEQFVATWFQRDVEMRSKLIFQSVEGPLVNQWKKKKSVAAYRKLFDNIARDERVLAISLCSENGKLIAKSAQWPKNLDCPPASNSTDPLFSVQSLENEEIQTSSFQLPVKDSLKPRFIVLHNLHYASQRQVDTRLYLIGFLVILSCIATFVTLLTARLTMQSWIGKLRRTLSNPNLRLSKQHLPREFLPLVREVRRMLREIEPENLKIKDIRVEWTAHALEALLKQELPDSEVIVVSNREPYIHNFVDGKIAIQRPASGMVTALEPITKACKGTWIACGSGSADKKTVDEHDRLMVPPEDPAYTLRRIWLTEEEEDGYYYGFANEGLWPLCHISFVRPIFRESDWETYKKVNRKFADAVIKESKTKNPIVLIQDYHLALVPSYVRKKLPNATIITFWHIPWPNPELFSICPWREEILKGLLGSSVLGFHTQFHCRNFISSVDQFIESNISRDQAIVTRKDNSSLIRPYPISIAWPPDGMKNLAPAAQCHQNICKKFSLPDNVKIGVGIERLDYTKGIVDRFQAIRELLINYPEWRGRFCFIQVTAPTRSKLPSYKALQDEALDTANDINKEFGNEHYRPIIFINRHHEPDEVFELFRAADFCVISSLHDGMNLVAKEFVAAREDEKGVLILSSFTGASKELLEALIVNPYDTSGMAETINQALIMPIDEQIERIKIMRDMVRENNIYFWAARMLLDAALLRKRDYLEQFTSETDDDEHQD